MGEFPRKSDGRRVFTVEFKRDVVQQLLNGETLAEVARELDIQPSVVRQWKRRIAAGATAAVAMNEDVVPVSALREAHQRIRELERPESAATQRHQTRATVSVDQIPERASIVFLPGHSQQRRLFDSH